MKASDIKSLLKPEYGASEKEGVFFIGEPPKDMAVSRDKSPRDKSQWSYWRKSNFDFFADELSKLQADMVLADIGAGQGEFSEIISRFNSIAVDFYPYDGINIVCDFTSGLPFRSDSVDILLLSNVLEHVPEPEKLLRECFRVLKKKGVLLGSAPFIIGIHQKPYDFFRYTDVTLKRFMSIAGFSDISIEPVLMEHKLLFGISAHFFHNLITRSVFSDSKQVNLFIVFLFRALWWMIRLGFRAFDPLFRKSYQDAAWPLGYLFRSVIN